jgi:broad specificity phosphatase PhoE
MLLYLVRHGDRATKTYNSIERLDRGLTEKGIAQVRLLAVRLKNEKLGALYASPFPRTRQTASAIAGQTGLKPVFINAFRELDIGRWNGFMSWELDAAMPGERRRWYSKPESYRFPGGENVRELRARVMPALRKIIRSHSRVDDRVCIVTHQAVIQMAVCVLIPGVSLADFHEYAVDKASLTVLETRGRKDGGSRIVLYNDLSYLKKSLRSTRRRRHRR